MVTYALVFPLYPNLRELQQLGTLVVMLPLLDKRVTNSTTIAITIFAMLHVVGGHYIYSYTPYNEWVLNLTGFNINEYFGFERNHYDRLVHFSFGLLFMSYAKDIAKSLLVGWLYIQTFSMVYELFEWGLTLIMAGDTADYYNGQQGDMWDAHKDMGLAMIGSTISVIVFKVWRR